MPLAMNREVFITCAVTGSGGTQDRSPHVPRSPAQIAESAIAAAKAGAAVVHCHVRDPETGAPARDPALYRELTERIRDSATDVVLNLTAGMGGDLLFDGTEAMNRMSQRSDMAGAAERVAHVVDCRPEICTLDCGTMNFASGGDYIMTNTPSVLRKMAKVVQQLGVRPELEVFDTGHLVMVKDLIKEGLLDDPIMIQLCMGIAYGAPDDPNTFMALVNQLPNDCVFSAFSISRMQLPFVAQAVLAGGNVRVGLEDNLYLDRGQLATNGQLVERARKILENMNVSVMGPADVRAKLKLTKHS
jgi:uncharacterized protein (DUF849 family)